MDNVLAVEAALPVGMQSGWPVLEPVENVEENFWLRWPAGEILAVRVLSAVSLHYRGHWYPAAGTYRLCTAPRCALCPQSGGKAIASPVRVRHLLTVELAGGAQRIWEFSEPVARQLQCLTGYSRRGGGEITRTSDLLGLRLLLSRLPPRSNGAVVVAQDEDPDIRGDLPPPIDAAGYVSEAWRRAAVRDGKALPARPFG